MGEKILLVDDDPEIQLALGGPLREAGYEVRVCENGNDVLPAILDFKPDLLLLDVMLPGMDGYSLVMRLSEDESLSKLPIVVVSGLGPSEALLRGFDQVKDFISKPFNTQDLLETVKKYLGR